jgi:hypothetical protein
MIEETAECEGKIKLGPIPWEISERLAQTTANWLEFVAKENAIVIKETHLEGCPVLTGIPCELINLLGAIPPEHRENMPGGELYLRDANGQMLRLQVENGEVRIQWPRLDYSRSRPVSPEQVFKDAGEGVTRVKGWARFAGSLKQAEVLRSFVERFGGLYPEGDIPSECEQHVVSIRFKDARVTPQELVRDMKALAFPIDSLQAELDVTCASEKQVEENFRIRIRDGVIEALKPCGWNNT